MEKQKIIFLKSERVILRPLDKKTDLEFSARWINDQEVIQYLSAYLPNSLENEEKWFDDLQKNKENIVLAIETSEGVFIGITGLHRINWKDRTAGHGVFIGNKEYWGKGYGVESHMLLLDYAFKSLNLRKINSSAIAYNQRSINYHLTCGYQVEGKQRWEVYKKGEYWDLVLFGLFKDEWLAACKKHQNKKSS